MWYFSWMLGLGLALAFGILNAIWYEIVEQAVNSPAAQRAAESGDGAAPHSRLD